MLNELRIRHFGVRDAILPSGAKTIVKTMEFPRGKFASGTNPEMAYTGPFVANPEMAYTGPVYACIVLSS